jgi:hypothetical protein
MGRHKKETVVEPELMPKEELNQRKLLEVSGKCLIYEDFIKRLASINTSVNSRSLHRKFMEIKKEAIETLQFKKI